VRTRGLVGGRIGSPEGGDYCFSFSFYVDCRIGDRKSRYSVVARRQMGTLLSY